MSVLSAQPTATCLGTQVGRFATTQSDLVALGGCTNQCQFGPSSSNAYCGTSLGVPTYCCYRPSMVWSANGASVTAYPYISVPFGVRPLARGPGKGRLRWNLMSRAACAARFVSRTTPTCA